MKISPFQEKNGPELYLEWEKNMKHIFKCHNYTKEEKVKLTIIEFIAYALYW